MVTDHQPLTLLMNQQVLSRVQTRWIRLGVFQSIQPTIRYQPGKANIIADALSKTRGTLSRAQEPEDDAMVNVMTRSMIVPTEEVQLWHKAQREDPVVQEIIEHRKKQKDARKEFELSPQGILYRVQDGRRKLMVPVSLQQCVLQTCHNDPTTGHVGIHRTLEIV